MPNTVQNVNWKNYIHYFITVIIMFGFKYLPNIGPVTDEGMVILGAFIGAVYGWSTINMLWPSLFALLALGVELGMVKVLTAGFGNAAIWMVCIVFIVVGLLNDQNIIDNLSSFFMTRKIIKGRPWVLITMIFIGNFLCSIINPNAALIIFLTLVFGILKMLGIKPYGKIPTMLGMGLVIGTAFSSIVLPFKSAGLVMVQAWTGMTGAPLDYMWYMLTMFPIAFFVIFTYVFICRFIMRLDVSIFASADLDALGVSHQKMTKHQKIVVFLVIWIAVDLLAPSVLPSSWLITKFLNSLTMFGQVLLPVLVFMVIPFEGQPILDFKKYAAKSVPWDIFMLVAVIMNLVTYLTADSTGIKQLFEVIVSPFHSFGPFLFLIAILIVVAFTTNFANNAICGIVMMPILYTFAQGIDGMSTTSMLFLIMTVSHFAFLTPGATPYAAIFIGSSEWIKPSQVWKYGLPTIIALFIIVVPVAYLWTNFMY